MKTILLCILLFSTVLFAVEYHVDKEQKNKVTFISDAPVEEIVGVTNKIDGYVLWDDDDLRSKSEFYFEVDLATLDTGIGLRNRHMQDNYLETDKFPFASYAGSITEVSDNDEGSVNITTEGVFKLHGVERKIQISGVLSKTKDGYKATSQFELKLEDYKIERPQLMLLKIGEVIKLEIELFAVEFKE